MSGSERPEQQDATGGEIFELYLNVHPLHFGASSKGPITIPLSAFECLTALSMPQVSFEFLNLLLFHGGDTGSIPVRDANTVNLRSIPFKYLKAIR